MDRKGRDGTLARASALGAALSLGIYIGLLLLSALLLVNGAAGEERMECFVWVSAAAAAFLGAISARHAAGTKGAVLAPAIFCAAAELTGLAAKNGYRPRGGLLLLTAVFVGAALANITKRNEKARRRPKRAHRTKR